MSEALLSAECIANSTAIEVIIKRIESNIKDLQVLAKVQYDLEWENFEQPVDRNILDDIGNRLDVWTRLNDWCKYMGKTNISGLLGIKKDIRETENKLKEVKVS